MSYSHFCELRPARIVGPTKRNTPPYHEFLYFNLCFYSMLQHRSEELGLTLHENVWVVSQGAPAREVVVKSAFTGTIIVAFVFSASPCLSEVDAPRRPISEREIRIISVRQYTALLVTACNNGWRYSLKHVESGFKRHLKELKLQLLNDGYTIVTATVTNDDDKRRPAMVIAAGIGKSATLGCARPYWLETRGQIPPP